MQTYDWDTQIDVEPAGRAYDDCARAMEGCLLAALAVAAGAPLEATDEPAHVLAKALYRFRQITGKDFTAAE